MKAFVPCFFEELGPMLRQIRIAQGYTNINEMVPLVGLSNTTICRIENRKMPGKGVYLASIVRYARFLQVELQFNIFIPVSTLRRLEEAEDKKP